MDPRENEIDNLKIVTVSLCPFVTFFFFFSPPFFIRFALDFSRFVARIVGKFNAQREIEVLCNFLNVFLSRDCRCTVIPRFQVTILHRIRVTDSVLLLLVGFVCAIFCKCTIFSIGYQYTVIPRFRVIIFTPDSSDRIGDYHCW